MSKNCVRIGDRFHLYDEAGRTVCTFPVVETSVLGVQPQDVAYGLSVAADRTREIEDRLQANEILERCRPKAGTLARCGLEGNTLHLNEFSRPEGTKRVQREPGAGRTFKLRKITAETSMTTSNLLSEINTNSVSEENITQDFDEYCRINQDAFTRKDVLLLLFAVDMILQGIKISSARTYVRRIVKMNARRDTSLEGPLVTETSKILSMLETDEEVDHAPDIKLEEIQAIIRRMEGIAQATVWFMATCGARVKDLSRLKRKQIRVRPDGKLDILFSLTKNHRAKEGAYTITVEPITEMPLSVLQLLNDCALEELLFTENVDSINKAIHAAQVVEEGKRAATSYSFRRNFVQRMIEKFTDDEGFVNWAQVAKLTAHKNLEVLRNRYTKPFGNTL